MQTEKPILDVPTGQLRPFEAIPIPRTGSRLIETSQLHREVRSMVPRTAVLRRDDLLRDWESKKHALAIKEGRSLLSILADHGMAWRDIARLVGVSVPAIQKWRRGEGITGQNRLRLAGVVALLECLTEKMVNEPISWLEMPVVSNVSVNAMDLLIADRYDLVLELASDEPDLNADRLGVLDEFDPHWRESRVDSEFEVFEAPDGYLSIRPTL